MLPAGDAELVQIVDAALADSAARSGAWLACRPGCNQCCTGVFRINMLDAERLRAGFRQLAVSSSERSIRLASRVSYSVESLRSTYPGDTATGLLHDSEESLEAFEDFGNEATCPVLDPVTGTCDLYAHRPLTCRTFGPPVPTEDGGYGVCELCFAGAPAESVAAAAMHLPDPNLENELNGQTGLAGETIIAFALQAM